MFNVPVDYGAGKECVLVVITESRNLLMLVGDFCLDGLVFRIR